MKELNRRNYKLTLFLNPWKRYVTVTVLFDCDSICHLWRSSSSSSLSIRPGTPHLIVPLPLFYHRQLPASESFSAEWLRISTEEPVIKQSLRNEHQSPNQGQTNLQQDDKRNFIASDELMNSSLDMK